MPTYRSITLSLISQFDILTIPEFPSPQNAYLPLEDPFSSDGASSNISQVHPTITVYIPLYPSSQFWLKYSISPPHPPSQLYYFKLFILNKHVVSWGCGEEEKYNGKTMFALFDAGEMWTGARNMERRMLCFGECAGDMEVRVYRAKCRKRTRGEATKFLESEVSMVQDSNINLMPAGMLERHQPQRFYRYALLDPIDQPFAIFRYCYRTWEQLETLGIRPDYASSTASIRAMLPPQSEHSKFNIETASTSSNSSQHTSNFQTYSSSTPTGSFPYGSSDGLFTASTTSLALTLPPDVAHARRGSPIKKSIKRSPAIYKLADEHCSMLTRQEIGLQLEPDSTDESKGEETSIPLQTDKLEPCNEDILTSAEEIEEEKLSGQKLELEHGGTYKEAIAKSHYSRTPTPPAPRFLSSPQPPLGVSKGRRNKSPHLEQHSPSTLPAVSKASTWLSRIRTSSPIPNSTKDETSSSRQQEFNYHPERRRLSPLSEEPEQHLSPLEAPPPPSTWFSRIQTRTPSPYGNSPNSGKPVVESPNRFCRSVSKLKGVVASAKKRRGRGRGKGGEKEMRRLWLEEKLEQSSTDGFGNTPSLTISDMDALGGGSQEWDNMSEGDLILKKRGAQYHKQIKEPFGQEGSESESDPELQSALSSKTNLSLTLKGLRKKGNREALQRYNPIPKTVVKDREPIENLVHHPSPPRPKTVISPKRSMKYEGTADKTIAFFGERNAPVSK
ncbi:MAG: hypothetical protein M1834_009638 [Cirrosporium novae-zelandiae]|nr:MAG: hypothetical protein M1834_009638 [Cirrosporium novae-zelandiae]